MGSGPGYTESSKPLRGRSADRTRASSPRQLPMDHDYAVSIREYQGDQPSRELPRPRPALPPKREKEERRKQLLAVDRSFHIRGFLRLLCGLFARYHLLTTRRAPSAGEPFSCPRY